MRTRGIIVAALVAAVGFAALASAEAIRVPNGNFERGNLARWDRFERGGGSWFAYDEYPGEQPAPRRLGQGFQFPDPPQGKFAAGVDQGGPGLNILHRVLKLKPDMINKLRFKLFYRNTGNRFVSPKNFKFDEGKGGPARGGGPGATNQQLRVDLMKRGAPIKSLKDKHILATLLWTKPGDPKRTGYRVYRANMTRLGIKKRAVRLRIAEVDDGGNFFVGVDAVKQKAK